MPQRSWHCSDITKKRMFIAVNESTHPVISSAQQMYNAVQHSEPIPIYP